MRKSSRGIRVLLECLDQSSHSKCYDPQVETVVSTRRKLSAPGDPAEPPLLPPVLANLTSLSLWRM